MKAFILLSLFFSFLYSSTLRPEQLYVVYTYNFLKNIQWTQSNKLNQYKLLVITKNEFLKENFKLLSESRTIEDKKILVDFVSNGNLQSYSAIFINKDKLAKYNDIYMQTEGSQTLLITNQYPDQQKIMINLIELDTSRISFEINRANILNDSLKISDEMVMLRGTEIDVAKLYKQTRESLKDEEKHSRELMETIKHSENKAELLAVHILNQSKTIEDKVQETKEKEKELFNTKKKIKVQDKMILEQLLEVKVQKQLIGKLKNNIQNAKRELNTISEQVIQRAEEMSKQKEQLKILNSKAWRKDSEINELDKTLEDLKNKIQTHQNNLIIKEETISSQKGIIIVLLIFIGIIIVLIFELTKLIKENKRHAERDFLTGLYNRRFFSKKAKEIYKKGFKKSQPLILGMIDIDHFKSVNDTYGHDMGDEVLKQISQVMQDILGEDILIARWGGEEFIVLLKQPKEECIIHFENLKQKVGNLLFYPKDKEAFSITLSTGVYFMQDNDSIKLMIEEADKLLYDAKEQGRNRIIYSD